MNIVTIISIIFGLSFIAIWIMSLYIAVTKQFKNKNTRFFWILILFFIPITAFIFIFTIDHFIDDNESYNEEQKRKREAYNRLKEKHQRLKYATWEIVTSSKDLAYSLIKTLQNTPKDLMKDKMLELVENYKEDMHFLDRTGNEMWNISNRMSFVECVENVNIGEVAPEPYMFQYKDDETSYFVMYLVDIELVKNS